MIVDFVVRSRTLQNVTAAVTHNFKGLALTVCAKKHNRQLTTVELEIQGKLKEHDRLY